MTRQRRRPVLAPAPGRTGSRAWSLPDNLVLRSVTRLRLVAALVAFGGAARAIVPYVGPEGGFGDAAQILAQAGVSAAVAIVSLTMLALSFTGLAPRRLLRLGQIYFVAVVALTAALEGGTPWTDAPFARGVPLPCPVLLIFPVIVPLPPRRFVTLALVAIASAPPAIVLMAHAAGFAPPGAGQIGVWLVPLVVSAAVAYVAADVIYGLGKDLGRAERMGSYRLVSRLGQGGMGEVWRAAHGMLARQAAIKLIRKDKDAPDYADAVARFEHEARVVSSLRSPHTIQLWDFGLTDDGALYYAMELLDGMDLDALVQRQGPVPPERAVHFLLQACHSLAEAHAAGLVHRDIKPANLFVTRLGRDVDIVKVLDFGLATRPVSERLEDTRVTKQAEILGTPAFMAPEQVLGASDIDGRADLYALGHVAYWLLTGQDVFKATSAAQVMFAQVHVEPEPPSAHAPGPLPPGLDRIVLACLAKRRDDRPPDAEALADALRAVPLATPWTRERAQSWWAAQEVSSESKDVQPTGETLVAPAARDTDA